MLISGFTFVRNIEKLHYPAKESIESILPIVDEFVINVCESDDNTLDIIKSINSDKIKIIESPWDSSLQEKGLVLSNNTNIALKQCKGAWCFYLQADEVVHEDDLTVIKSTCKKYKTDSSVEGLLFNYLHFYGSYQVLATARNWYRREVRILKNNIGAKSVGDAQGFRINEHKPKVKPVAARIFHYGWVRPPEKMGLKNKHFFRLWHGAKFDEAFNNFSYEQQYGLKYFHQTHPSVMKNKIKEQSWDFIINKKYIPKNLRTAKNFLSDCVEKFTGLRLGEKKNYELI